MIHQLNNAIAIQVPEGANNFVLDMGYLIFDVPDYDGGGWVTDKEIENDVKRFLTTGKSKFSGEPKLKPLYQKAGIPFNHPGQWQILSLASLCTEEEAREVVESSTHVETVDFNAGGGGRISYTNYMDYEHDDFNFETSLESLQSFCRSINVPAEQLLILKNK